MHTRWQPLLGFVILAAVYLIGAEPAAAPAFSEWNAPVLVPNVSSASSDEAPAVSKDGRSLYFGSNRPGGFGGQDLWVSQRPSAQDPWGPPINLGAAINTNGIENVPAFSADGHWMFFNSDRPGGTGLTDLWVSYRRHTHDDFDWEPPINLGPEINSPALDLGPSYFEGELEDGDAFILLFFGSTRPGGPGLGDLYESSRNPDGSFGPARLLPELSSPSTEQRPSIRRDGLEIYFFSNRPEGSGGFDLWVARRETLSQVWSTPENLGAVVNGSSNDLQPYIAPHGQELYFASNRPGGPGLNDLYVVTRTKAQNHGRTRERLEWRQASR